MPGQDAAGSRDFATVSGCNQLVVGPTHARGGTLEVPKTDVPDLLPVLVEVSLPRIYLLFTLRGPYENK